MKQQTKEWRKARVGKLTASRAGAALGVNPWQKPDDLIRAMVREAHGAEPEFSGNVATQWGHNHEPLAVLDYMSETGVNVVEAGIYIHPEHDWLGASPDGFVGDDAIVEIKCPYSQRDKNPPHFKSIIEQPHYWAQVQIQLSCTGRSKCYFYQWAPYGTMLEQVVIDEDWLQSAIPDLQAFYELYLSELDNPEHLKDKRIDSDNARLRSLMRELGVVRANLARLRDEEKQLVADIVELAGERDTDVDGAGKITKVVRRGNVDYAKLLKEHFPDLDIEPYRGKDVVS